jgi:SAM-dependent methyltransferase
LVGVDIDQKLLDLAGLLLSDHQATADLTIADITNPGMPERLGIFDVVFCNDVLEHVVELDEAARNLARLVKPGGRLFLEIPNGLAIRYIDSDGHYKLPGITLLDHTDAERWFRSFYQDNYPYRTFFYAPLDYYLTLFSRQQLPLRLLNAPYPDSKAVSDLVQSWSETLRRLQTLDREFPEKPADLIEQIRIRSSEADTRIQRLLTTATTSPISEERGVAETVLRTTFGLESFLLEGRMPD